jgi:hypothetical protein
LFNHVRRIVGIAFKINHHDKKTGALKFLKEKALKRSSEPENDDHVAKIPDQRKLSFRSRVQGVVDEFAYRFPNTNNSGTQRVVLLGILVVCEAQQFIKRTHFHS